MSKNKILAIVLILLLVLISLIFFFKKDSVDYDNIVDNNPFKVENRVINLNNKKTNAETAYLLYSDHDYKYFINQNPKNMYVLLSEVGIINDKIYKIALDNLKNNKYKICVDNNKNSLYMNNIIKSLYMEDVKISDISPYVEIYKESNDVSYIIDEYVYIKDESIKNKLYYTDKYNTSIYLDGISSVKIAYENQYVELSSILKDGDFIADTIYYNINIKNEKYEYYPMGEVFDPYNLFSVVYGKLKIAKQFRNNELYYVISLFGDSDD
ncbi:MAG: hypothetical protein IJ565_02485 [Bacilli bacterium]|nr:hypothetical protein [Bacilli bacterium]